MEKGPPEYLRVAVTLGWLKNVCTVTVVLEGVNAEEKKLNVPFMRKFPTTHMNKAGCLNEKHEKRP